MQILICKEKVEQLLHAHIDFFFCNIERTAMTRFESEISRLIFSVQQRLS